MDNNKLPIVEIFTEAITLPKKYASTLLRLGTPLIIIEAISIIGYHIYPHQQDATTLESIYGFILGAIYCATLVMAVIGCHRAFLLSEKKVNETKAFRWTMRETRYIGWWIGIMIMVFFVALPLGLLLMPLITDTTNNLLNSQFFTLSVGGVLSIPIYYVISRFSLILPATAIDINGKSLSWAWKLSSGNSWRLTLLIGLAPFTTDLILNALPTYNSLLYSLSIAGVWLIIGVVEIGLLSLSYSWLSKNTSNNEHVYC